MKEFNFKKREQNVQVIGKIPVSIHNKIRIIANKEDTYIADVVSSLLVYAVEEYEREHPITDMELATIMVSPHVTKPRAPYSKAEQKEYETLEEAMNAIKEEE